MPQMEGVCWWREQCTRSDAKYTVILLGSHMCPPPTTCVPLAYPLPPRPRIISSPTHTHTRHQPTHQVAATLVVRQHPVGRGRGRVGRTHGRHWRRRRHREGRRNRGRRRNRRRHRRRRRRGRLRWRRRRWGRRLRGQRTRRERGRRGRGRRERGGRWRRRRRVADALVKGHVVHKQIS